MKSPKQETKSILVIQTAFVGDIVLTTSFLAGLRALAPQAKISLLTTPAGVQLLTPNPWNIQLLPYDKRGKEKGTAGFLRKARELRALKPQLVFCLHRSLRSALLAKVTGGFIVGFQESAGSVLFGKRVSRKGFAYEAEKNLALLKGHFGEAANGIAPFPALSASDKDRVSATTLLLGEGKFVALAPSSVWATKRWPVDKFAELAKQLWQKHQLRSVIVGGQEPQDIALGKQLAQLCEQNGAPVPRDLSGKTNLGALKVVLQKAELVVSNDSAPLHIAIAMGTKTVGVFGPTTKELGFFPLAPEGKASVAEVSGLSCRPCGLHGHAACPQGHFRCMLELSPDTVGAAVDKLLCQ